MKNIAKILCFVFSLVFVLSAFGIGTFAEEATGLTGEGTVESPYLINNLEDLLWFRSDVNAGNDYAGKYVKLNADIDLTHINWSVNIGDDASATFDGIFDGGNHTIYNLKSTETAQKGDGYICTGLFGAIHGEAVIKNLTIENVKINTGDYTGDNIGVVVGFAWKATGSIENVTVKGTVKIDAANASSVGVILGYDYSGRLTIDNCAVKANAGSYINAAAQVGGISGYTSANFTVNDCLVENLTIKGKCLIGGVAGLLFGSAKVTDCTVNNVDVYATKTDFWSGSAAIVAGGLVNSGTTITGLAYSNVTENGVPTVDVAGSAYAYKPTEKVPAINASINDVYYVTLQEAVDAATDGDVIVIANNIDLSTSVILPTDKAVVIDLNGYTITGTDNTTANFALFSMTDANLTINDTVGGGKITLTATNNRGWNSYSAIIHNRGGIVTINGGALEHLGGSDMAYVVDNSANYYGDANLTVNGGSLISSYIAIRMYMSNDSINGSSIVEINDGYIYGVRRAIWGQVPSSAAGHEGELVVNGGTLEAPAGKPAIDIACTANGDVDVVINNGNIKGDIVMEADELTIANGGFSGALILKDENGNVVASADVISGGEFTTDVSAYCVNGFMLIPNASGSFGISSISATPVVGENGNWWIGDVDTGMIAYPEVAPAYCEEHGVMCWFVTGETECRGQAIGTPGTVPTVQIIDGYWYIDNKDGKGLLPTGVKAVGTDGLTITSVHRDTTKGDELVSVYVVTFSNGYTWSFTVTNGVDGIKGLDGAQGPQGPKGPQGPQGESGKDGNDNNQTVVIVIAIATVCLVFTLSVLLYRGVDRRSWWCTR